MRKILCFIIAAASLSSGCVTTSTEIVRTPAGVAASRGHSPASTSQPLRSEHVVARGETLYAIAFRRGLDWRDLAAWNGLGAPYTIYPGQRLRLGIHASSASPLAEPSRPAPAAVGTVETRPLADVPPPAASPAVAAPPAETTRAPVGSETTQQTPIVATGSPASTPPRVESPSPASVPPVASTPVEADPIEAAPTHQSGGIRWRWPTQGEVIQRFTGSDLMRQGINIAGRSGQAVVAAADGEIVYSGSGLRGYGELIIIKHSGEFLSAYGHNSKRLVAEGQQVKAGQPIAEMGRTGTDRDKLHFEIRRNGKPVDPMQFLPRS